MERQRMPLWLIQCAVVVLSRYLARGEKYQRSFLVVIRVLAVVEIAAFDIFQQHGIKSIIGPAHLRPRLLVSQIDHRD